MNELELVKASISGSRDAFCDLYDLYRVRLYRYAYYRLRDRDDAEDAVSSCVLSAWEQIGKLKEPEAFTAWISRILRGSCVKIIKVQIDRNKIIPLDMTGGGERGDSDDPQEVYSSQLSEPEAAGSGNAAQAAEQISAGSTAPDPEQSAVIMEALNTLDEESREMVLLSAVGRLTSRDIGEMYGMPQGTVRSRISRSLAAMRKLMEAGNER